MSVQDSPPIPKQSYVRELWQRRDFTFHLAWGRIRAANATTALGVLWWVLNPLLLTFVYLLVFGVVLDTGRGESDYLAYLMSGMFVFYYTRQTAGSGVGSIVGNRKLLANLNMPKLVMPIAGLIEAMVGFAASLVVLVVINAAYAGIVPGVQVLYAVPAFLIQSMFNLGFAALFARAAVAVRDVTNVLPYILRIWLYLSPVIWPLAMLNNAPGWVQTVLEANPTFGFIGMFRSAFLNTAIEASHLVTSLSWALLVGIVGVWIFVRSESEMLRGG